MKGFFLILLLSSVSLFANPPQKHYVWGIKGGLNIATLSQSMNADMIRRISFNAGGFMNYRINRRWSFQPEVNYSGQGAIISTPVMTTETHNLDYINIPILFQCYLSRGFFLEIGPQIGVLVNARSKENGVVTRNKNEYENIDLAMSVGAGFYSKYRLGVDVRYNAGINQASMLVPDYYNNVIQIDLFYRIKNRNKCGCPDLTQ